VNEFLLRREIATALQEGTNVTLNCLNQEMKPLICGRKNKALGTFRFGILLFLSFLSIDSVGRVNLFFHDRRKREREMNLAVSLLDKNIKLSIFFQEGNE
jgi:hypothetical protein